MNFVFAAGAGFLSQLWQRITEGGAYIGQWIRENPGETAAWFTGLVRWIMPLLALSILISVLRSMLLVKNPPEHWAHLTDEGGNRYDIPHWECTLGRARHCDVVLADKGTESTQCALIREDGGNWTVHELAQAANTLKNGCPIGDSAPLEQGDLLSFGGVGLRFLPLSQTEAEDQQQSRKKQSRFASPWFSLFVLTIFQLFAAGELILNQPESWRMTAFCFFLLASMMWGLALVSRLLGSHGFEAEILAFFCCTLSLSVTASAAPEGLFKQTVAIGLGLMIFLVLGWYLRDLKRATRLRFWMALAAVGLLAICLVAGQVQYGAKNWIRIGGFSLQPSELAKICFVFAGSATLDRLFVRRNLIGFMLMTGVCLGCLALMSDFGTAAIFFVCFLVISYLRSGDFATLSLIAGGAAAGLGLVLKFKPYIAARFSVWGHAWENASGSGYQQVRTMCAAASGGLIGVGAGGGWLKNVAAADTDLVFGMLCEEWGLLIALLAVACVVTLSVFAVRVTRSGRSAFYTTAACAATSLLVFQTILNVCGSVDILPLTGVTFPFVSCGGSSMMAAWGLLAFVKAADTRQGASFAVRRHAKGLSAEEASPAAAPGMPPPPPLRRPQKNHVPAPQTPQQDAALWQAISEIEASPVPGDAELEALRRYAAKDPRAQKAEDTPPTPGKRPGQEASGSTPESDGEVSK